MYRINRISLCWILCIALASCGTSNQAQPDAQTFPNILLSATGEVLLKREGWTRDFPVSAGTILEPQDVLETTGSATILCHDLKVHTLTKRGPMPCVGDTRVVVFDDGDVLGGGRGQESDAPYIIFPRNTAIMSDAPTFVWNDTRASSYTVKLYYENMRIWENEHVQQSTISSPVVNGKDTLTPGNYSVDISDNDHPDNVENIQGLGFTLLTEDHVQFLRADHDNLARIDGIDENLRALAYGIHLKAYEVDGRGVWGEARIELERASQALQTPASFLHVADTLRQMKLFVDARAVYEQAIDMAMQDGDVLTQAEAQLGLWYVTSDQAYLDKAEDLYAQLGGQSYAAKKLAPVRP